MATCAIILMLESRRDACDIAFDYHHYRVRITCMQWVMINMCIYSVLPTHPMLHMY